MAGKWLAISILVAVSVGCLVAMDGHSDERKVSNRVKAQDITPLAGYYTRCKSGYHAIDLTESGRCQRAQLAEEHPSKCDECLCRFFSLCRCSGLRETWRRCCRHCAEADDA